MSIIQNIAWLLMAAASITITYQDFKTRTISLWTIIAVLLSAVLLSASNIGFKPSMQYWGMNVLFLILQFGLVALAFGLGRKQWRFFDELMGWGDVLHLLALSALFSTVNFLLFYCLSLLGTLFFYSFFRVVFRKAETTVPLAGAMAICSILFVATSAVYGYWPWDEVPIYLLIS